MTEYKILKVGELKYDRIKSMSILRKGLNTFDLEHSLGEIKELLDSIISGTFEEQFDMKYQHCFDKIFDGMEYEEILDEMEEYSNYHFPKNFIPPIG